MNYHKNNSVLSTVKEWVLITVGIAVYTLGWTLFLTPNNLFGGGVTGISAILQFATGIKMGYTYFVINVALLIASLFLQVDLYTCGRRIAHNCRPTAGSARCWPMLVRLCRVTL